MQTKDCERCGNVFVRKPKYSGVQWEGARFCSRHCGTWNLGLTKHDDPRMVKVAVAARNASIGRPGWSKGLTKHTHPSLAIVSQKVSATQRGRPVTETQLAALKIGQTWRTGKTKENCESIARGAARLSATRKGIPNPKHSERMKRFYASRPDLHPNSIVGRKTKGKGYTYIEKCVADYLTKFGVEFKYNVRVGTKWPDFSIESHRLIVEADGEYWHQDAEKEKERDSYLNSIGWQVLHLPGKLIVNEPLRCCLLIAEKIGASHVAR